MPPKLINPWEFAVIWFNASADRLTALTGQYGAQFDYPLWLYNFRLVMKILAAVFLLLLLLVIYKLRVLSKARAALLKTEPVPLAPAVSAYDNRWAEIRRHVASFNEAEWKLAVIEADKFADDALRVGGYPGESRGERLMLIQPDQLLSLQTLWDAHKLRNLLVHDANYRLTHRQAVLAVEGFEVTLRELGALS